MRLGVLDVGSNTVHLLIVDAHAGARPAPHVSHRRVLRLMRYLSADGSARAEGVDAMLPFATSALREASNGPETLALIAERTGVELQVLAGDDEARLTFLAVRRWLGWSAGSILLFDIGGGSLEIASGVDEYPDVSVSVPLGAGRSTVGFLHNDPPTSEQMQKLRRHSRRVLAADATPLFSGQPAPQRVVGSSKTIRSLARLAGSTSVIPGIGERTVLRRSELKDWIPRLAQLNAEARQALPGITPDRTFQIVGGAVVLHSAMKLFDVEELEVSPWALREGIILRYLDTLE